MRAVRIHAYGDESELRLEGAPDPVAGPGDVLIRLHASSVNPVDVYQRAGRTAQMFPIDLPAILGVDGAGVVEAVGGGVAGVAVGDRVIVRRPPDGRGTHAELVASPAASVARIPDAMGWEQAATLPLAGLTGRQLVDLLGGVGPGARVLVAGALGAVGRAAVQYLKEVGAVPVAGVRAARLDEGRALAGEALDIGAPADAPAFDVAIAAAGPVVEQTAAHLRDGGVLTSAVRIPDSVAQGGRIRAVPMLTRDDPEAMARIVEAAERGDLAIPVAATFALSDLAEAHRAYAAGVQGKIVIRH